jgi:hypothetical protein
MAEENVDGAQEKYVRTEIQEKKQYREGKKY